MQTKNKQRLELSVHTVLIEEGLRGAQQVLKVKCTLE
jgi:hypothetical protein